MLVMVEARAAKAIKRPARKDFVRRDFIEAVDFDFPTLRAVFRVSSGVCMGSFQSNLVNCRRFAARSDNRGGIFG